LRRFLRHLLRGSAALLCARPVAGTLARALGDGSVPPPFSVRSEFQGNGRYPAADAAGVRVALLRAERRGVFATRRNLAAIGHPGHRRADDGGVRLWPRSARSRPAAGLPAGVLAGARPRVPAAPVPEPLPAIAG